MTTTTTTPSSASAAAAAAKAKGRRQEPGAAGLGQDATPEARRLAAAILEVLAGARTPGQAAAALGISLPRYYQVETRAVEALVAGCVPRPRGPGRSPAKELSALRRQHERLQRELSRQQTLVRLAQRTIGLAAPAPANTKEQTSKRRRRRASVRALRAAKQLQPQDQPTATVATDTVAAATPATDNPG